MDDWLLILQTLNHHQAYKGKGNACYYGMYATHNVEYFNCGALQRKCSTLKVIPPCILFVVPVKVKVGKIVLPFWLEPLKVIDPSS